MEYDYTGRTVYVGIDVHKNSYSVCCFCDGAKVKNWSMRSDMHQLIDQLKHYFSGAKLKSAYEAGFSGTVLHRALVVAEIENKVVNPGSIEVASRDRVKTDRPDATKLAQQLSNGQLRCIYIPSEEEELARQSVRLRVMLVKDRRRMACRIKSKLMQFGYWGVDDQEVMSEKLVGVIQKECARYPKGLAQVIEYLCEQWSSLTKRIKALDKEIAQETAESENLHALEELYRSVPGLGRVSAHELSRELGTLRQFTNIKELYSFTGLTPSEFSSGDKVRRGSISHCGRPRLRHLLIEIAWRSIRKDTQLRLKFNELAARRGKKRAIVAIARILMGRLRACCLSNTRYRMGSEMMAS